MHIDQFAGILTAILFIVVIILELVWAVLYKEDDYRKNKKIINRVRILLLLFIGLLWGIVGLLVKVL